MGWHIAVVAIVFALSMNQRSRGNQSRAAKLKPRGDEAAKSTPRFRIRGAQFTKTKPQSRNRAAKSWALDFAFSMSSRSRLRGCAFAVSPSSFSASQYRIIGCSCAASIPKHRQNQIFRFRNSYRQAGCSPERSMRVRNRKMLYPLRLHDRGCAERSSSCRTAS